MGAPKMSKLREYRAMIWPSEPGQPGKRVCAKAENLMEAKKLLEKEHGVGSVYDLHCPEDADRPR
jgi:hypothetical protein